MRALDQGRFPHPRPEIVRMLENEAIHYRPVEVVDLKTCPREEIVGRFLEPGIPCIIENLYHESPAHKKWTKDYFLKDLGQERVRYHILARDRGNVDRDPNSFGETDLADFIERIERGERIKHYGLSHPYYDFLATDSEVREDVKMTGLEKLLPARPFMGLSRLDSRFWPWLPPYAPHFLIAGGETMTPCHFDPDYSETLHWCVWGHKLVKLFAFEEWNTATFDWELAKLDYNDLSNPIAPEVLSQFPRLKQIKGWSAELRDGQSLFIPSRMYHAFKNAETSMSFVVQARDITSLDDYCDFAFDVCKPEYMIRYHAPMWRALDRRHRTLAGSLMANWETPLVYATRVALAFLRVWMKCRTAVQGRR